jgi:hypothetical protein
MDNCSKIFSLVMKGRAFKLLGKHGTRFQFGGTPKLGCRDGLFVLKTLLTMQKNHNLLSYVLFVDLVEAYDMANHSLILDILEQYGASPRFVSAIECTYQDLIVVLKIEQEVVELPQTVGVQQGNNMAPVLFLSLLAAFTETLETEWKNAGIGVCTVRLVMARNWHRVKVNCTGIGQKNTSQGGLPQSKSYNASMLMMEPSYLRHDPT